MWSCMVEWRCVPSVWECENLTWAALPPVIPIKPPVEEEVDLVVNPPPVEEVDLVVNPPPVEEVAVVVNQPPVEEVIVGVNLSHVEEVVVVDQPPVEGKIDLVVNQSSAREHTTLTMHTTLAPRTTEAISTPSPSS